MISSWLRRWAQRHWTSLWMFFVSGESSGRVRRRRWLQAASVSWSWRHPPLSAATPAFHQPARIGSCMASDLQQGDTNMFSCEIITTNWEDKLKNIIQNIRFLLVENAILVLYSTKYNNLNKPKKHLFIINFGSIITNITYFYYSFNNF